MRLCCDILMYPLSLLLAVPLYHPRGFLSLFLIALLPSGSSGAGVPPEAAAGAGRSSKENHPAA